VCVLGYVSATNFLLHTGTRTHICAYVYRKQRQMTARRKEHARGLKFFWRRKLRESTTTILLFVRCPVYLQK
jgi:hypothetical protein